MTDIFTGGSSGSTPGEKVFNFAKKHAKLIARAAAVKTAATVVNTAQVGGELIGQGISNAREAVGDAFSSDQTMPQEESPAQVHAQLLANFQQGQQHTTKMPGVRRVNK